MGMSMVDVEEWNGNEGGYGKGRCIDLVVDWSSVDWLKRRWVDSRMGGSYREMWMTMMMTRLMDHDGI
jgi:hypothetical protein